MYGATLGVALKRKTEPPRRSNSSTACSSSGSASCSSSLRLNMAEAGRPGRVEWLLGVYLLHTLGELSLSPVGLSAVTKLAPQRIVGR